ncbi:hypothetical protein [Leuconostoc pseudomesenteroides]|uniref:hypothetical protein n=1 Tax=Leuconostoc pseudomesenteroides TaxID=33968 RepID=UPI0039E7C36A
MTFDNFEYAQQLKKDLMVMQRWQVLVETLSQAETTTDILEVVDKILEFDVHEATILRVASEHWYPSTHWVTLAFAKLAGMSSLSETSVVLPQLQKVAELHFAEFPNASFRFTSAPLVAGGYYLEEISQNLRVLYWDMSRRRFYLDTNQFGQLVQTEALQLAGLPALKSFQQRLTGIADQLREVDYDVDLIGIDAKNSLDLTMRGKDLPVDVLDSLFVAAAKQHFVLKSHQGQKTGATLQIADVTLDIIQNRDEKGHSFWHYDIIDNSQDVTLYSLLQQLPFLAQWYNMWLEQVGLKDHREVFVE